MEQLTFRGGAYDLFHPKGKHFYTQEGLISGGNETGKTIPMLWAAHQFMKANPGAWGMFLRKDYADLKDTVCKDFEYKILEYPIGHPWCPVHKIGGENPRKYIYKKGGGEVLLRGLDDKADNTKSLALDMLIINQLEEFTREQYEQLYMRATGRAGNTKWTYIRADCNPSTHLHWILNRPSLLRVDSKLEDNPRNHDGKNWTAYGNALRKRLQTFTGTNYYRLYLGEWRGSAGLVYKEFDEKIHIVDKSPSNIPDHWIHFRLIDFGYNAPFVCQHWAIDPTNDAWYMFYEIYMSGKTLEEHIQRIHQIQSLHGKRYNYNLCDHDPEKQKRLTQLGIPCRMVSKIRKDHMINAVKERLASNKMFFSRNAVDKIDPVLKDRNKPTSTIEEFGTYSYKPENKMKGDHTDDIPPDGNDDGMDLTGYAAVHRQDSQISVGFKITPVEVRRPV